MWVYLCVCLLVCMWSNWHIHPVTQFHTCIFHPWGTSQKSLSFNISFVIEDEKCLPRKSLPFARQQKEKKRRSGYYSLLWHNVAAIILWNTSDTWHFFPSFSLNKKKGNGEQKNFQANVLTHLSRLTHVSFCFEKWLITMLMINHRCFRKEDALLLVIIYASFHGI